MKKKIKKLINLLKKKKLKISVVESCTGGLLSSQITSESGASKIFSLAFITYSNKSKINILKVKKEIIQKYGSVSLECCSMMVKNLKKISKSDICVSITGIAGPGGGTKFKPVGLIFIGLIFKKKFQIKKVLIKNKGRKFIQISTVRNVLNMILKNFN